MIATLSLLMAMLWMLLIIGASLQGWGGRTNIVQIILAATLIIVGPSLITFVLAMRSIAAAWRADLRIAIRYAVLSIVLIPLAGLAGYLRIVPF